MVRIIQEKREMGSRYEDIILQTKYSIPWSECKTFIYRNLANFG